MLIYIGISILGLVWLYSSTVISFLWQAITGYPFLQEIYLILGICIAPITMPCWIYVVLSLAHAKDVKFYVLLVFILILTLYILFILLTFTRPEIVGEKLGNIDIQFKGYGVFYFLVNMTIVYAGFIIFMRDTFKSVSPELKLKGLFISLGLITFTVAATLDGWFDLPEIPLIITRISEIISSILAYIGWIMPESVKKVLLRKET